MNSKTNSNSSLRLFAKRFLNVRPRSLFVLNSSLLVVATVGTCVAVITFVATWLGLDAFDHSPCFDNSCVKRFLSTFDQTFVVAKGTLDLLVALATTGGIIVALLSYLNSASATALTNHIAHFTIFQDYVSNEIAKRRGISPGSIDILVLYNLIFSTSRNGKTDVSDGYIDFVCQLNALIDFSNEQAQRAKEGSFRYKQHQERIRDHLMGAGLTVSFAPRNDFFETEGQVFALIDRVNQSFCYSASVPVLIPRKYN